MRRLFPIVALLLAGCGPFPRGQDIKSLTDDDFEKAHVVVVNLCASYQRNPHENGRTAHEDEKTIFGSNIPEGLAFLKPQAVRYSSDWAIIFLYKTPAGEDSISFHRKNDGSWIAKTHIGSWKNSEYPERWNSEKR